MLNVEKLGKALDECSKVFDKYKLTPEEAADVVIRLQFAVISALNGGANPLDILADVIFGGKDNADK